MHRDWEGKTVAVDQFYGRLEELVLAEVECAPGDHRLGRPPFAVSVLRSGHHRETWRSGMWAQLISARLKPGKEGDLTKLFEQVQAAEQTGSGLLRSTFMRDQNDPSRVLMLVVFDSEEHARAREQDQRREQGLQAVRATMAETLDGPLEFTDLLVVNDLVV